MCDNEDILLFPTDDRPSAQTNPIIHASLSTYPKLYKKYAKSLLYTLFPVEKGKCSVQEYLVIQTDNALVYAMDPGEMRYRFRVTSAHSGRVENDVVLDEIVLPLQTPYDLYNALYSVIILPYINSIFNHERGLTVSGVDDYWILDLAEFHIEIANTNIGPIRIHVRREERLTVLDRNLLVDNLTEKIQQNFGICPDLFTMIDDSICCISNDNRWYLEEDPQPFRSTYLATMDHGAMIAMSDSMLKTLEFITLGDGSKYTINCYMRRRYEPVDSLQVGYDHEQQLINSGVHRSSFDQKNLCASYRLWTGTDLIALLLIIPHIDKCLKIISNVLDNPDRNPFVAFEPEFIIECNSGRSKIYPEFYSRWVFQYNEKSSRNYAPVENFCADVIEGDLKRFENKYGPVVIANWYGETSDQMSGTSKVYRLHINRSKSQTQLPF